MSTTHYYRCIHEEAAREAAYFADLPPAIPLVFLDDQEHLCWHYSSRYHHLRPLGQKSDGHWYFSIRIHDDYERALDDALLRDARIEPVSSTHSRR